MAEQSSKVKQQKRKVVTKKEVTVNLPVVHAPYFLQGFVDFVREQGVVGLAIGLVLGVASKAVIDSLVANIFNPIVGLLTGGVSLESKNLCIKKVGDACTTNMHYGKFLSDLLSFLIVIALVYFIFKALKLERLAKKKD